MQKTELVKKSGDGLTSTLVIILLVFAGVISAIVFPPVAAFSPIKDKPIILYYDYGNLPFQPSQFPSIVNFTLRHGFNTLMLVVYINHETLFNRSTIQYFISYSESRNLTFVPSYYIRSPNDRVGNLTGLGWVNLDMEYLNPPSQDVYYDRVAQQVPFVSVTTPYGQPVVFKTPMNIIETYASPPSFWLDQLGYPHQGKVCSIAAWRMHDQQEYDLERYYCLHFSGGVMVFDYYNLLKSGLK